MGKEMKVFGTEAAKMVKTFNELSIEDADARKRFIEELADCTETHRELLKALLEEALKETIEPWRSEKSDSGIDIPTIDPAKSKKEQAVELAKTGKYTVDQIAEILSCHKRTVTKAFSGYNIKYKNETREVSIS